MAIVQSVVFPKNWSKFDQIRWLKAHKYRIFFPGKLKPDITINHVRYRQEDPTKFDEKKYYTEKLPNGVLLIMGELKPPKYPPSLSLGLRQ